METAFSQFHATVNMFRQDFNRIDPKRRHVDHRKQQFVDRGYKDQQYPHRLNFYATPPTADITLEQFEQWAIDRLRGTRTNYPGRVGRLTNSIIIVQSSPSSRHARFATNPPMKLPPT